MPQVLGICPMSLQDLTGVAALVDKSESSTLSLGGSKSTTQNNAVNNCVTNKGHAVVVAAGNSNKNACNYSPSSATKAITVGATDTADKRASFSNYGSCLDIFAPGVAIKSAYKDSDTATATWSGTSMASPHVAGICALIKQETGEVGEAITFHLIADATTNKVGNKGSGSPDRLAYSL